MQESFGKRDTVFHTRTWGAMDYVPGKEKGTNLGANFRGDLSLQEKSGWGRATSFNITKS